MLTRRNHRTCALILSLAVSSSALPARSDIFTKANNASNLNLPASWGGGVPPGSGDIALFNNTLTAPNTTILGANLSWLGMQLTGAPAVTINPDGNTLTLGSSGITLDASSNGLTLGSSIFLGAPQTWSNSSSTALIVNGTISGTAPLTLAGNVVLNAGNTWTGGTTVNAGTVTLGNESALGGATAGPLAFGANSNATLRLSGSSTASNDIFVGGLSGDSTAIIETATATSAVNTLVINSAGGSTFSGTIHDGAAGRVGIRLLGGTQTLSGTVTTTGSLTVHTGKLILSGNQVNIVSNVLRGSPIQTSSGVTIGDVGNAVLQMDGANLFSNVGSQGGPCSLQVAGGTSAQAALIMNAGVITTSSELWIGAGAGSYGALILNAGTVTSGNWLAVSRANIISSGTNATNVGILNIHGGVINVNNLPLTIGSIPADTNSGVLHASVTATGGIINANQNMFVGELSSAIFTISNNALLNVTSALGGTSFNDSAKGSGIVLSITNASGIFNLNGGTVTTTRVIGAGGTGAGKFDFNGGVLKVASVTPYAASFFGGLTSAYVYPGGAFIDDSGQSVTIPQPLVPPTGNGVASIVIPSGSGYFAPPFITITGGGGTGATAVANIDASGNLTGVSITNPGVGYTGTPTISIFGGGGTLPAGSATVTLSANSSGGLTKLGLGTLTLSGVSTYTGSTNVNGGMMRLTGTLTASPIFVNSNATLYAARTIPSGSPVTVNGGGVLGGTGSIGSVVTLAAGSSPASQGALGILDAQPSTITLTGGLAAGGTAGNSSLLQFDIGMIGAGNDAIALGNGSLTINPGGALIHLNDWGAAVPGSVYTLMTFNLGTALSGLSLDASSTHLGFNTVSMSASTTAVTVSISGPAVPPAAYWTGTYGGFWNAAGGAGNDQANFNTNGTGGINTMQVPGPTTDVFFSADSPSNLTTTLGQNFIIKSLTIKSGSGGVTINGSQSLTIQNGITVEAGAGGLTINAPVALFTNQTWNNLAAVPLIIGGVITGTNVSLTMAGNAQLLGNFSLSGTLAVASGNFQLGNGGAAGTIGSAVGVINNSTVTFNRSDAFLVGGTITGTGSVNQSGSGTATLSGSNSYTGGTTISNGTVAVANASALGAGPVLNNSHLLFVSGVLNATISNNISGSGDVTCSTPDDPSLGITVQFTFSGSQAYSDPTYLSAGIYHVYPRLVFSGAASHSIGPVTGTGMLQVNAGAALTSDGVVLSSSGFGTNTLTVNGTHVIRTNGGNSGTSELDSLLVANDTTNGYTGKLDITNNKLVLRTTGSSDKSSKISQLNAAISAGSNGATWTGKGITSGTAAADPVHLGVGLFDNATLSLTSFGGQPTDTNSLLVSVALLGDTNFSGAFDMQDLTLLSNKWQQPANNWAQGDINNNGIVDSPDVLLGQYNWQGTENFYETVTQMESAGSFPGLGPVPEPASLALLASGFLLLTSPKSRKRR